MDIQIVDSPLRHALVSKETCRHDRIGDALQKVLPYCYKSAKPHLAHEFPICRYVRWGELDCDIEAGFLVADSPEAPIGTKLIEMPAGREVFAIHNGPPHRLIETHNAVMAFMQEHQLEFSGPPWEHYVVPPGTAEVDDLVTHVYVPIM